MVRDSAGKVYICGDFEVTIEIIMMCNLCHYQMNFFTTELNVGTKFTKLDLANTQLLPPTCMQIENSKQLLVLDAYTVINDCLSGSVVLQQY